MDSRGMDAHAPRLLVSVCNRCESSAALQGGCHVLDIKDPSRGSLGMASPDVIGQCIAVRDGHSRNVPVSAALGEVVQWIDRPSVPALPPGLQFVKLGTSGLNAQRPWQPIWRDVRRRFEQSTSPAFRWIAVAYVDWREADGIRPVEIVESTICELEMDLSDAPLPCAGVLLDTYNKHSGTLFDWITTAEIRGLVKRLHRYDLFLAVAGRLNRTLLPDLAHAAPDIIAIRSAACSNEQRSGPVTATATSEFHHAINKAFACEMTQVPPSTWLPLG